MNRPATGIRDVADLARVSIGTVSNVLNRPDVVATATRDRVLAAIAELGFVRNESARQLRAGRSRTLGLVVLDVANPFFTDMARGAEDAAYAAGLSVVLCNSDEKEVRQNSHLDLLEQQRVDGVLITPVTTSNEKLDQMRHRGTPVVLLDRTAGGADICSVAVDDVLGGHLAMSHLLDQGHRRTAFVGGPITLEQVRDRLEGSRRAVERDGAGSSSLALVETAALNVASGRAAGEELAALSPRRRPTGVFCANDLLALGFLQVMTRQGIRVPEDVAIVGYDDIDFAAAAAVPLSSIRQPRQLLGRTAAELLIEEATEGGTHRHQQLVFDPELVVRQSTAVRRRRVARSSTSPPVPLPARDPAQRSAVRA